MKRVTASQARKHWFQLLDDVIAGETVQIERNQAIVVLKRESLRAEELPPDYRGLIQIRDPDGAERWGWRWDAEEGLDPIRLSGDLESEDREQ